MKSNFSSLKMKIGIITCSNAENYGARLQCYALSRYLMSQGHDVQVIDYRPPYMRFDTKLWYKPQLNVKSIAKLVLRYNQRRNDILRHQEFERFSQDFIPLSDKIYGSIQELQQDPPRCDVYIAGSDQIWNTQFPNGKDGAFFLDFGDENVKRISYAASFGTDKLVKDSVDSVREHLNRFDAVSVRESSGLEILKSLGYEGVQVVDPVFLLSRKEWNEIIPNDKPKERFLLVYDQMGCDKIKSEAKKLAKERGLKVYSIGSRKLSYADRNFRASGPQDFLWLIKNAESVISNSFHALAFSFIFQKQHYLVEREDGLNQRMLDFIVKYGDSIASQKIMASDICFSKTWINSFLNF